MMLKIRLSVAMASLLGVVVVTRPMEARSATTGSFYYLNPAQSCQLSIPTIDTVVAPRANGYRNPGNSAAFVICGFVKTNELPLGNASVAFVSTDGQAHGIACTGVNSFAGYVTQSYVSKTVSVPATGFGKAVWTPADFGGSGAIPDSDFNFSITCNLPPQVAITLLTASYSYEIGA